MYFILDSNKSFEDATRDLATAVTNHGFGVLHIHDLGATLRAKGLEFKEQCQVFEICNPLQAAKVLSVDMRLSMVLPCRISVFTEHGRTRIGVIKPVPMLAELSQASMLLHIAQDVEIKVTQIVRDAV